MYSAHWDFIEIEGHNCCEISNQRATPNCATTVLQLNSLQQKKLAIDRARLRKLCSSQHFAGASGSRSSAELMCEEMAES